MAAAGYFATARDQLHRFRQAVVADSTGEEIDALVTTAPRGYAKDHPQTELIRRKGLMLSEDSGTPAWLHRKRAAGQVRSCWSGAQDVCDWLDAHVGPSTEPPSDRPF